MKIMKIKLKRKHWIILGALSAVLLLYFGVYLHFRLNHTFVHRAGRYGARVSGNRPRRSTNHFIQPSRPSIDVMIPIFLSSEKDEDPEKIMQEVQQAYDAAELRRERLLLFFEPAAFLEVCVWKLAKPNPLPDVYGNLQNKVLDATSL